MGASMPDRLRADVARPRAGRAVARRAAATSGSRSRPPSASCDAWFVEQGAARGLAVERDGFGNPVAWWRPGGRVRARRVLTGSHLDSVLDGGAYDGPLGVVSALAAVDLLRDARRSCRRGRSGSSVFVEEEGSRFGLACLGRGSRPARRRPEQARELRDRDGVRARRRDGRGRARRRTLGPGAMLDGVGCFVELHVEQGRDLVDRGARGRGGERDLAARALPLRLHRRGRTTPAPRGWRTGATRC